MEQEVLLSEALVSSQFQQPSNNLMDNPMYLLLLKLNNDVNEVKKDISEVKASISMLSTRMDKIESRLDRLESKRSSRASCPPLSSLQHLPTLLESSVLPNSTETSTSSLVSHTLLQDFPITTDEDALPPQLPEAKIPISSSSSNSSNINQSSLTLNQFRHIAGNDQHYVPPALRPVSKPQLPPGLGWSFWEIKRFHPVRQDIHIIIKALQLMLPHI
jgi:hypothetical protein